MSGETAGDGNEGHAAALAAQLGQVSLTGGAVTEGALTQGQVSKLLNLFHKPRKPLNWSSSRYPCFVGLHQVSLLCFRL